MAPPRATQLPTASPGYQRGFTAGSSALHLESLFLSDVSLRGHRAPLELGFFNYFERHLPHVGFFVPIGGPQLPNSQLNVDRHVELWVRRSGGLGQQRACGLTVGVWANTGGGVGTAMWSVGLMKGVCVNSGDVGCSVCDSRGMMGWRGGVGRGGGGALPCGQGGGPGVAAARGRERLVQAILQAAGRAHWSGAQGLLRRRMTPTAGIQ